MNPQNNRLALVAPGPPPQLASVRPCPRFRLSWLAQTCQHLLSGSLPAYLDRAVTRALSWRHTKGSALRSRTMRFVLLWVTAAAALAPFLPPRLRSGDTVAFVSPSSPPCQLYSTPGACTSLLLAGLLSGSFCAPYHKTPARRRGKRSCCNSRLTCFKRQQEHTTHSAITARNKRRNRADDVPCSPCQTNQRCMPRDLQHNTSHTPYTCAPAHRQIIPKTRQNL